MSSFGRMLCLLGCLLVLGCGSGTEEDAGVRTAWNFQLQGLDHRRFYLSEQRGRVVVLAFWATYCLPCHEELLAMNRLQQRIGADRLAVAAICIDPENIDAVRRLGEDLKPAYPILLDNKAEVFNRYGLTQMPATVIVDRQGNIAYSRYGFSTALLKKFTAVIERLLEQDEEMHSRNACLNGENRHRIRE